jgi:hypothetical protein
VPPRIKATTLESQLIHLIQELSGRTLTLQICQGEIIGTIGCADQLKEFFIYGSVSLRRVPPSKDRSRVRCFAH